MSLIVFCLSTSYFEPAALFRFSFTICNNHHHNHKYEWKICLNSKFWPTGTVNRGWALD